MKSFLGLAGYYRKLISQASKIAKTLNGLKKDQLCKWGSEQIQSFQPLKNALIKEPVLQYPDFTRPIILTTMQVDFQWGQS